MNPAIGQTDSVETRYGKLPVTEIYANQSNVFEAIKSCTPCLVRYHEKQAVLKYEAIQFGDCFIGSYQEYFPSGEIKLRGQFRGSSKDISDGSLNKEFCSIPDGKWLYYNQIGEIKAIEIWEKGEFIEQKPNSKKVEIWKVQLFLNEVEVDTSTVSIKDFHKLQVIPRYKNTYTSNALSVKLELSAVRYKTIHKSFPIEEFPSVQIKELIHELGVSDLDQVNVQAIIYDNGVYLWQFNIKLAE